VSGCSRSGRRRSRELPVQVIVVDERADLEERAFHPADQVFDRALLLGRIRKAQLDADTQLVGDCEEGLVPLRDRAILAPLDGDRLGPIEDGKQRHTAKVFEVLHQRARQCFGLLIEHAADPHDQRQLLLPARVVVADHLQVELLVLVSRLAQLLLFML
jgi:hypothetical protein